MPPVAVFIGEFLFEAIGPLSLDAAMMIGNIVTIAGIEMGLQAVTGLLKPKPQAVGVGVNNLQGRGSEVTGSNPTKARDLIFGDVGRRPGTIVYRDFTQSNGFNRGSIHLVIALAGHQLEEIGDPYAQNYNEPITLDPATGDCVAGRFAGKIHCEKFLGSPTQAACATLVGLASQMAIFPNGWTVNHRLQGVAYVYVRMDWDETTFNQGFPDLRFDVLGKNDILDPRSGGTSWTNNPLLCLRDYFTWQMGIGCYASEVNDAIISAEATVCDESVALAAGGTEKRYTCNGAVDLAQTPADIVNALLGSCAGTPAYLAGQWAFYSGHWLGSVGTIADDDLASGVTVNARQQGSDLYNGVKGIFISAANNWQASDFPPFFHGTDRGYAADDYLVEDGGLPTDRRWKDIQLPFTTSAATAQRLAKIDLESHRRQKTLTLKTKLSKFAHQPPDVITFSHPRWGSGFVGATFRVSEAKMALETPTVINGASDNGQQAPGILMDFSLRETDANAYAWSTTEELRYTPPSGTGGGQSAPPAPLISEQLLAIPTGLEFGFNFITYAVVQGYWVYRSDDNDITHAIRYRHIAQSISSGVYIFQDNVGAGVTKYYWISAFNAYGESALTQTFSGPTAGLGGTHVMTVYRPSASSGTYSSQSAAYDNNLNVAATAFATNGGSKQSVWSGFAAAVGTPVSITLRVSSDALFGGPGTQLQVAKLELSTDAGASFGSISSHGGGLGDYGPLTESVTLSTSQDMTQVQVRATITTVSSTNVNHSVYEIWAEIVT